MTDTAILPYRCPKCFHTRHFPDIATLRIHLETDHSYLHYPAAASSPSTFSSPRSIRSSYNHHQSSLHFLPLNQTRDRNDGGGFSQHARELEKQLLLATGFVGTGFKSQHGQPARKLERELVLTADHQDAGFKSWRGSGSPHQCSTPKSLERELVLTTDHQGAGFKSWRGSGSPHQCSTPKSYLENLESPRYNNTKSRLNFSASESPRYSPREVQDQSVHRYGSDDDVIHHHEMVKLKNDLFEKDRSLVETSLTLQVNATNITKVLKVY